MVKFPREFISQSVEKPHNLEDVVACRISGMAAAFSHVFFSPKILFQVKAIPKSRQEATFGTRGKWNVKKATSKN